MGAGETSLFGVKAKTRQQSPAAAELARRKEISRSYLRSLPPEEKIQILMNLQEQYFQFLLAREKIGGKPVPERWLEWYQARHELPLKF